MDRDITTIAFETSILLVICLLAAGGNFLVVFSIYRNQSLRTITNYFVFSLAVTDILYAVFGIVPTIASSIASNVVFGNGICTLQALSSTALPYLSVVMIASLAVNRYVCVCKPNKYKKYFNRKRTLTFLIIVWIVGFGYIIGIQVAAYFRKIFSYFLPSRIMCIIGFKEKKPEPGVLDVLSIIFGLVLPFVFVLFCYMRIFRKIQKHKKHIVCCVSKARRDENNKNTSNMAGTGTGKETATAMAMKMAMAIALALVMALIKRPIPRLPEGKNNSDQHSSKSKSQKVVLSLSWPTS